MEKHFVEGFGFFFFFNLNFWEFPLGKKINLKFYVDVFVLIQDQNT